MACKFVAANSEGLEIGLDVPVLAGVAGASCSAWVKLSSLPAITGSDSAFYAILMVSIGPPPSTSFVPRLRLRVVNGPSNQASAPGFTIAGQGSDTPGTLAATTGGSVAVGVWTHVVGIINYLTGFSYLYVNGVLASSASSAMTTGLTPNTNAKNAGIGNFLTADLFDGIIDDLRLYGRVLTPNEIYTLYTTGGRDGIWDGCQLRYQFLEDAPSKLVSSTVSVGSARRIAAPNPGILNAPSYAAGITSPRRRNPYRATTVLNTTPTPSGPVPLAEYLINEASSGQGPTSLLDSQPSPTNLPITYVSTSPSFGNDAHGDYLFFPTANVTTVGAFSAALNTGNKIFDAFNGATSLTYEIWADINWLTNPGYIFNVFGITQNDGENDCAMFWSWAYDDPGRSDVRMECDITGPLGFPTNYYKFSFLASSVSAGAHYYHMVVDTNNATTADRIRLYVDGVRQTAQPPNQGTDVIPQGMTIAIPTPSTLYQVVGLGGIPDYGGTGGTGGNMNGKMYYAAIYDRVLTDAEILSAPTRIGTGD